MHTQEKNTYTYKPFMPADDGEDGESAKMLTTEGEREKEKDRESMVEKSLMSDCKASRKHKQGTVLLSL